MHATVRAQVQILLAVANKKMQKIKAANCCFFVVVRAVEFVLFRRLFAAQLWEYYVLQ